MTLRRRVAHVVHCMPGEGFGGAEATLGRLIRQQRASWDVSLVDLAFAERGRPEEAGRPRVVRLSRSPTNRPRPFGPAGYAPDRPALDELTAWLESLHPDLIHFHWTGLVPIWVPHEVARAHAVRIVTVYDFSFRCANYNLVRFDGSVCPGPDPDARLCGECYGHALFQRIRAAAPRTYSRALLGTRGRVLSHRAFHFAAFADRMRERQAVCQHALESFDRVIAPGKYLLDHLVQMGVSRGRIEYLPYPVPVSLRQSARPPPPPPLRLGFMGRIVPQKGVELAVRLAARLATSGIALEVFGPFDPSRDEFHRRLASIAEGMPVSFRGPYSDPAVPLSRIHLLLFPSLYQENNPIVVHEAIAAGVPVLASDLDGVRKEFPPGAGLLVPPGEEASWEARLREFATEPDRLARFGSVTSLPPSEKEYAACVDAIYEAELARTGQDPLRQGPRTGAVILHYGNADDTRECLRSLQGQEQLQDVILVDNAVGKSPTAEGVELLVSDRNLGYAGGSNRGIRRALEGRAQYVFVLNNDTEVERGAVRRLVEFLEANPTAGAAQPLVVRHDLPDRIDSAGLVWDDSGGAHNAWLRQPVERAGTHPFEVAAACGSALMLRSAAVREVGFFDESLFMIHEDVDLAWRLGLAGWKSFVVPTARVRHKGGVTQTPRRSRRIQICYRRNRLLLLLRYWPARSFWRFLPIHLSNAVRLLALGPEIGGLLRGLVRSLGVRLALPRTRWREMCARWLRPAPSLLKQIRRGPSRGTRS